jgi:hypothetical protein
MQNAGQNQLYESITLVQSFFASDGKKPVNLVSRRAHENDAVYLWSGCVVPGDTHPRNWHVRSLQFVPVYGHASIRSCRAGGWHYRGSGAVHTLPGRILFLLFLRVFILKRGFSFPAKLFTCLFHVDPGCWRGVILRRLGGLSSPRLLMALGPGNACFTCDRHTLLVDG